MNRSALLWICMVVSVTQTNGVPRHQTSQPLIQCGTLALTKLFGSSNNNELSGLQCLQNKQNSGSTDFDFAQSVANKLVTEDERPLDKTLNANGKSNDTDEEIAEKFFSAERWVQSQGELDQLPQLNVVKAIGYGIRVQRPLCMSSEDIYIHACFVFFTTDKLLSDISKAREGGVPILSSTATLYAAEYGLRMESKTKDPILHDFLPKSQTIYTCKLNENRDGFLIGMYDNEPLRFDELDWEDIDKSSRFPAKSYGFGTYKFEGVAEFFLIFVHSNLRAKSYKALSLDYNEKQEAIPQQDEIQMTKEQKGKKKRRI